MWRTAALTRLLTADGGASESPGAHTAEPPLLLFVVVAVVVRPHCVAAAADAAAADADAADADAADAATAVGGGGDPGDPQRSAEQGARERPLQCGEHTAHRTAPRHASKLAQQKACRRRAGQGRAEGFVL